MVTRITFSQCQQQFTNANTTNTMASAFLQTIPTWGILVATAVTGLVVVQVLGLFKPKAPKPFLDRKTNSVRRRVSTLMALE